VDGQLGLESTLQEYIAHLMEIFGEVWRVLKPEGTCWVVIGDTYSGSPVGSFNGGGKEFAGRDMTGIATSGSVNKSRSGVKPKSLCQIPSRFAIAMTDETGYVIKNKVDAAWLGGLVEGEGCITIAEHRGYYEPRLQIAMVDEAVLLRVKQITGVGTVIKQTVRNNPKWNDSYIWKVGGSTAANICADIFPYLISKRENARIIWRMVEMQEERPRSGGDPYSKRGLRYTEQQKLEHVKWYGEIKNFNQGVGNPTNLKDPTQNKPWILRNTIIWYKRSCMPSSAKDRFTVDFEKVFFFVKQKKYWFEQQTEALSEATLKDKRLWEEDYTEQRRERDYPGGNAQQGSGMLKPTETGRNKRCVWDVTTKGFKGAHFAVFPSDLIETPILAGCPEGGIVLDPFMGSGTTALVAHQLGRRYIGFELNAEYHKMACERIAQAQQQTSLDFTHPQQGGFNEDTVSAP